MTEMINNTEWLRGYRAYEQGRGCPWGNESARQGWIAAKTVEEAAVSEVIIENCTHPASERITRTGHGYLNDYTGTHVLCGGCGADLEVTS